MMRKKIFCMCLTAAFLLPMVICCVALAQFDGDAHRRVMLADSVGAVIVAYNEAGLEFRKLENPTPGAILAHRQEWRDRLEEIIAQHPQGEFVADARSELLQLYKDLNELDKSQAVVRELIDTADTPEMKYLWYHELGAISQRRHQETLDESDLQKSQEALERANELFLSFSPETQKQLTRWLSPENQDDTPMQLDPIQEAFEAYSEAANEVRKDPSPVARLAHYQEWRDRFEEVIAENPQSMYISSAKRTLVSLYNGLNEYDKSQALLQILISEASTPEEKIYFLNQLGTVSRMRHATSQNQSDSQMSREAFEQANELFLSLPPEKQDGRLGGMQIINLGSAAKGAEDAGNHERAATLFRSARKLFQSSSESTKQYAASTYGLESIANQEMIQWIRVKEEANALECLKILSNLPSFRWTPSYYALKYASQWYEGDVKGFQNFVSKWLDENPFDDRTPILMAYLGFSYFSDKQYDKAQPIYETLRDNHLADFQRLEPVPFEEGSGGYYEQILFDLTKIYVQRGDQGKAESTKTELTTLLPESLITKRLTERGLLHHEKNWTPSERPRYLALRICLTVAGIGCILLGLYLAWRKEKNKA